MSKLEGFDFKKDWSKEIKKDEILRKDGKEFVFLRGLERLAKERGLTGTTSRVISCPTPESPAAIVTYGYQFVDGGHYEASADATTNNCDKGFRMFLTAMAESRAKARALRSAFGISMCSVEEISNAADVDISEDETKTPASDQQKFLIQHLCRRKDVAVEEILGSKKMDKLSKAEALEFIAVLNKVKGK